jgi:hypothetical protein
MIRLRRMLRGGVAIHVAAAVCAVFQDNEFGVQVIGERDDEEEQDQGAGEGSPFAPGGVAASAGLMRPAGAPENDAGYGDEQPEDVECEFH